MGILHCFAQLALPQDLKCVVEPGSMGSCGDSDLLLLNTHYIDVFGGRLINSPIVGNNVVSSSSVWPGTVGGL